MIQTCIIPRHLQYNPNNNNNKEKETNFGYNCRVCVRRVWFCVYQTLLHIVGLRGDFCCLPPPTFHLTSIYKSTQYSNVSISNHACVCFVYTITSWFYIHIHDAYMYIFIYFFLLIIPSQTLCGRYYDTTFYILYSTLTI